MTRDVPPYAIVAGVSARVLRFRFEPDVVMKLLEIAWWDWDDARIHQSLSALSSPDISQFLELAASSEAWSSANKPAANK